MPFNIIELVEAQVTPEVVKKVAQSSGETPSGTRSAMSAGVFAIVAGIIQRGSSTAGAASLLSTFQSFVSPGGRGGNLATSLLGDRADQLTDTVAMSSGVNRSTASGIMSALLPLAAGVLGREVASRRLDASGLSDLLQSQKRLLVGHPRLPSELSATLGGAGAELTDIRGEGTRDVGVYQQPQKAVPQQAVPRRAVPQEVAKRPNWLPLLTAILLGAFVLGTILLLRGRTRTMEDISNRGLPEVPTVEAPVVRAPAVPVPVVPEPVGQTTVTGAEIPKPATDELTAHMTGTGPLPDRFALPGVTFKFGSTTMTEDGNPTVDRLATLMKEHPSARVRLEGHTDSVGTAGVNTPLSYQRAAAVKKMLVDRGVDAKRIEVTGKRDLEPVAPNDTNEGRIQNRRIEAVIIQR